MMTEKNDKIDYILIQQKTLEQFKAGKRLLGKDGAFVPLFKQFLEAALNAELEAHIDGSETLNRKMVRPVKPSGPEIASLSWILAGIAMAVLSRN